MGGGGQAGAFGDQPRHPRRPVKARAAGKAAVHDDADAIDGEAGLRDVGGKDDLAAAFRIGPDRLPLRRGVDLPVQFVDDDAVRHPGQRLCRAVDLAGAGQEGEQVAALLTQRLPDDAGDVGLDRLADLTSDIAQLQRPASPFAFNDRRAVHQRGKARAVERRGHRDQPQVGPERPLHLQREREAEIAVDAAFVHLVEQHGGDARQFGVGDDAVAEYPLGQDQDARRGGLFAVHARRIADKAAHLFAHQLRNPLGRHTGRQTARGQEKDFAAAPWLVQQARRDHRGLARTRRSDQNSIGLYGQSGKQIRQDSVHRQSRIQRSTHSLPPGQMMSSILSPAKVSADRTSNMASKSSSKTAPITT